MPKPVTLYAVKTGQNPGAFVVGKLDEDFNVLANYYIDEGAGGALTCNCPAHKPWCRHCDILRKFQAEERVNTTWMYDFDNNKWFPPLANQPDIEE